MNIDTICALCIEALQQAGYNESTIFNYQGVVRRFKTFCAERDVVEYTPEIGRLYANDVISQETGKFSMNRYHTQGRFIQLIDSYFNTGQFDFSMADRGKVTPENLQHKTIYAEYGKFLGTEYNNENTIHFYEYGMYSFLQYLNGIGIETLDSVTTETVIEYMKKSKNNRQRQILCEMRAIFRYLN